MLAETGTTMEGVTEASLLQQVDLARVVALTEQGVLGKLIELDNEGCHIEVVVE